MLVSSVWSYSIVCCLRRPTFFQQQKKSASGVQLPQQFKNAALKRREAGTAQIALQVAQHALACKVGCKMDVSCETALRAVRDGMI